MPAIPFMYSLIRNKFVERNWKYFVIPLLINVVILIFNLFYGFIYKIDENCVYSRSYAFYTELGITAFYVVTLIVGDFIQNRSRNSDADDNALIIACYLLVILGALFQTLFMGCCTIYPSLALASILYYFYMKGLDDKRDKLTGLFNRAQFIKRMDQINKKGKLQNIYVGVFDVNRLKTVNDSYGHIAGDEALKETADVLINVLSSYGQLFRTGGDEFCFIGERITEADMKKCKATIDKKMQAIKSPFSLSVSQGYSKTEGHIEKDIYDTYNKADQSMYVQKEAYESLFKNKGESK